MISLPNYGAHLTLNDFMPLWNIIEDFIDKQKILSAGVCDFMLPLLSDLYNAAKVILKIFIFRLLILFSINHMPIKLISMYVVQFLKNLINMLKKIIFNY
jgi:hypothetical protein